VDMDAVQEAVCLLVMQGHSECMPHERVLKWQPQRAVEWYDDMEVTRKHRSLKACTCTHV